MILAKLKEATKKQHQRLETTVDIMNCGLDLFAYEKLLRQFYGFYAPVELKIRQMLREKEVVFYESRLKIPLLVNDVQSLNDKNFQLDALEICRRIPVLDSFAQTLGCLYVLEGATLGGQIISRHLRQHLNLTATSGAAFFNGYGALTGAMWKEFGAFITAEAEILKKDDEIIAAAIETFEEFDNWLAETHFWRNDDK